MANRHRLKASRVLKNFLSQPKTFDPMEKIIKLLIKWFASMHLVQEENKSNHIEDMVN